MCLGKTAIPMPLWFAILEAPIPLRARRRIALRGRAHSCTPAA